MTLSVPEAKKIIEEQNERLIKDSLVKAEHIIRIQDDSIALVNQLAKIRRDSILLQVKNDSLIRQMEQNKIQQVLIQQKDSIISKYGICYTCNGTTRDLMGRVCSTCNGTGYVSSSEVTRNNSVIQLRRIRPKHR